MKPCKTVIDALILLPVNCFMLRINLGDENLENSIRNIIEQIVKAKENEFSKADTPHAQSSDVEKLIQTIVLTYQDDWEKQKLRFAREFLSRTWSGIPLPVLSVCGRGTQEIRYSTYLGYFLDYSKPHGLNTRYLDKILSFLGFANIDTYKSIVESEKWLGQSTDTKGTVDCFCDIVVSTKTHWIFIEQKINSGESQNPNSETTQLLRYDRAIDNNPEFSEKNQIRIFLTPTGKISQKSTNWRSFSYVDLITAGMNTLHSGGLSNIAKENLKRFLMDLLLGPFQKAETEIQILIELAEKSVTNASFADRLRFDQLISRNRLLVDLLMEG